MRKNTAWLRRWASLSALTSAAIAAGSASGEAAIIYHGLHGVGPNAIVPLPGGNQLYVAGTRARSPGGFYEATTHFRYGPKSNIKTKIGFGLTTHSGTGVARAGGVSFRTKTGANRLGQPFIALAKRGQTFKQVGSGVRGYGLLGFSRYHVGLLTGTFHHYYGPPVYGSAHNYKHESTSSRFRQRTQEHIFRNIHHGVGSSGFTRYNQRTSFTFVGYGKAYALFTFEVGSQTDYGWLELNLGNSPNFGPLVSLIGYAYDTTGQPIAAGVIPEPKRLPLALGALALGAICVREWRAKRKAAA